MEVKNLICHLDLKNHEFVLYSIADGLFNDDEKT
jgi:hypothetical protein